MRRIGSRVDPHDVSGIAERGPPDGAVRRGDGDRIEARDDALVLGRVYRLVGLDIIVPFAVAVGVENERRPALCLLLVAGLLEELAIEPADDRYLRAAGARPQRILGVFGKDQ